MVDVGESSWEAPFAEAFDEDTQSFPYGTHQPGANPDCTVSGGGGHFLDSGSVGNLSQ